ncbi:hypothetical protein G3O08_07930 [Cryomorpha ignava]|uniref:Class I SAM-dependent methyltransferase n=1 Tax=Cryomorpha ignava TaxID=101383 RepID=A0A7K3WP52_9FLAO|nr:hypothetical protein [Cryomorpha ignava]NEN23427.1 hypothetical protein [Cryomorpha ignava]
MRALFGAIKDLVTKRKEIFNIWGGAFNGQQQRQQVFKEIISQSIIEFIVETGTFKGNTTAFMHNVSNLPILSVEFDKRNYYFAKFRFMSNPAIRIFQNDSRIFLEGINKHLNVNRPTLFYLDAHWNEDLPLKKEIQLILEKFTDPIIIIDDFKVPHDIGFKFDKYGEIELSTDLISEDLESNKLNLFFPKDSKNETGAKRGYIIVSGNSDITKSLRNNQYLIEHQINDLLL